MNTLRAFLFVLYTTAIVQANGQPVTPIIVDIPYQNPTSVKMNGMVKSIPEAEQFLQDTSSKFGRFDPIVIRLESNEDIYAAAVFARLALKSHDSVYIALKKPDKADAGYYLLPVGSNEATFTSSGASFPETQPTSIKADILVYKVESATTKKQYTFMANDAFLQATPRENQLSMSDAEQIAMSYVAKYRGLKRSDSVIMLECKKAYYKEVPFMFVTYFVLDKNKQILDPEDAMILFGNKSYLIPVIDEPDFATPRGNILRSFVAPQDPAVEQGKRIQKIYNGELP